MGDRGIATLYLHCRSRGLIAHRSTLARRSIPQMDVFSADWLTICRRIVGAQRQIFSSTPGSAERTVYEGVGEGGDHTLVIDRRCEDVVFAELERLAREGASFVAVSEERGEVEFGAGGDARVVIDPIDGSLNARRTIPSHSLSIAVASGPSMAAVEFGFVHDFGADEEFAARRGAGATLDGEPIAVAAPAERLEIVGLESAEPEWALPALEALAGKAYRLRIVGSLAITAAYVAAGRFDAMLGLRPCRSVDVAAAQLIVREAGGATAFGDLELAQVPLDLDARYLCAAARDDAGLATALAAQSAGDPA
jgi:myo-inositol-1(or 4)-monophosphatase